MFKTIRVSSCQGCRYFYDPPYGYLGFIQQFFNRQDCLKPGRGEWHRIRAREASEGTGCNDYTSDKKEEK